LCGIAGFTHLKRDPGPERIRDAATALDHRGPDCQSFYHSPVVSLGAARLRIIDLAEGDQPVISADGKSVIVFNGEIFNHLELRKELLERGRVFRTHTDTEVILNAFLEWDIACFERLRGMFAAAIWSEDAQRLVIVRDRMGIKPLYITRLGSDVLFASELKSLFVHPEVDRRLSPAGLDCYLSMNYAAGRPTMVESIEKMDPGAWLEWRQGVIRTGRYWQLPVAAPRSIDLPSAVEQLDSLLRESVREQMVADVPLAVWLSGGIDSSTITHYAAEASPTPLHTFSISFKGRTFDESDYIGAVAKQYGTRHEQLDLNTGLELADAIQEFAKFADDPNADAGALPVWFLSHLTRQSCTVALSGDGADEIFGGYLTYQADELARIARRFPPAALRLFRQALKFWPVSDEKISLHDVLKRFLDGCAMQPGRSHVYWNGTFSEAEKRLLVSESLPDTLSGLLRDIPAAARPLDQWMWFDQKYYLPDDILTKVDRMSMAHSLEVRPPFLDHRIVEFAASLPSAFKLHGAGRKVILKELMKGKLPPSVLTRKKVGFDIPAHDWLRGPLRELMTDTIQWGLSAHPDLFRRAEVESCMRRHAARQDNLGYHLWGLMILFLWMRQWRIQTVPASGSFHRPAESAFLST